jgi:hypothetical protein
MQHGVLVVQFKVSRAGGRIIEVSARPPQDFAMAL